MLRGARNQSDVVQTDSISLKPLYEHRIILRYGLNKIIVHRLLQERGRDLILLIKLIRNIQHDIRSDIQQLPGSKVGQKLLGAGTGRQRKCIPNEAERTIILHSQSQRQGIELEVASCE